MFLLSRHTYHIHTSRHLIQRIALNPCILNWYLSFLKGRQQKVINGFVGEWKVVNRGTTQGSVSGPHLFSIFLNDLKVDLLDEPILVKYADDSNIISTVCNTSDSSEALVEQFMEWSTNNGMSCNPSKYKEIFFKKKGCTQDFPHANHRAFHSWCCFPGRLPIYYACTE